MALRLMQLDQTNRSSFEALLAQAWGQNWGPELAQALIRWRYDERPSGVTWVICKDGQCVAMLDCFVRPYLLDGRRILVREGCDWYCLPKYRPLGLGLRLMRAMMAAPEPALGTGSEATASLLPRLHWSKLPDLQRYALPVKARGLAGSLLRGRWPAGEICARAIPGFIPLRSPRPAPGAGAGRVVEWTPGAPAVLPAPRGRGLVQVLERADLDWIARMPPEVAQPFGLMFFRGEAPVGFALAQLEPAVAGFEASIVHLQLGDPAQDLMDWVVAETAARLAARGAGVIRCLASSPEKGAALRRAGFLVTGAHPSYWWSPDGAPPPSEIDAGYLRADDILPFETLIGRHLARRRRPTVPAPARAPGDQHAGGGAVRSAAPRISA